MIFTKLVLQNFGVFAGTNEIEFHHDKPVVLIGGMNGRGKTTLLEAIVLGLYGRKSFLFREEYGMSYSKYLNSFINTMDGSNSTSIQIEFINEEDSNSIYSIKRSWTAGKKKITDDAEIRKNGLIDNFITDNWDSIIEGILPSEIAKFFFFDGEKIAQLASDTKDDHLKGSVKTLLGLNTIDLLKKDLLRIVNKTVRDKTSSIQSEIFEENDQLIKDLETQLAQITERASELNQEVEHLKGELLKKNDEFDQAGGRIALNREFYLKEKGKYETELARTQSDLLASAAEALPLLMVENRLIHIRDRARKEIESQEKKKAYQVMMDVFRSYQSQSSDSVEPEEFFSFFKDQVNTQNQERYLNITSEGLGLLEEVTDKTLYSQKRSVEKNLRSKDNYEKQITIQDKYLSEGSDSEKLQPLQEDIANLNQLIGNKNILRDKAFSDADILRRKIDRLEKERLKNLGDAIRAQEKLEEQERIQKYALLAIRVAEEYQIRLQGSKIHELEKIMTTCYKQLANKKHLIDNITIDPTSLEFSYLSTEGISVSPDSLSAGEKQLMVISLLWALAIASKKHIPVVIDTPLARLDKKHRELIVENYYPYASKQVIILTTDTEITEDYYKSLKPLVSDEFILDYDENLKSSTIQKGFFVGEESDSKANTAVE